MWLTTSSSLKRSPSSPRAWHSWLNRSGPSLARLSASLLRISSTRKRRARTPRHMPKGGTGLRISASEASTVSMKAWFMRSASRPSAMPMKTRAAMFSVSALICGKTFMVPAGQRSSTSAITGPMSAT